MVRDPELPMNGQLKPLSKPLLLAASYSVRVDDGTLTRQLDASLSNPVDGLHHFAIQVQVLWCCRQSFLSSHNHISDCLNDQSLLFNTFLVHSHCSSSPDRLSLLKECNTNNDQQFFGRSTHDV